MYSMPCCHGNPSSNIWAMPHNADHPPTTLCSMKKVCVVGTKWIIVCCHGYRFLHLVGTVLYHQLAPDSVVIGLNQTAVLEIEPEFVRVQESVMKYAQSSSSSSSSSPFLITSPPPLSPVVRMAVCQSTRQLCYPTQMHCH